MKWTDQHLIKKQCPPKLFYYLGVIVLIPLSYFAVTSTFMTEDLTQKTIPLFGSIGFIYLALCSLFILVKGDQYVQVISKEDNIFILINIFRKKFKFGLSEIDLLETSKFSIIDYFLTGFSKFYPGLILVLKNGNKFYITSDMEEIETLRKYLSGILK